jgi:hypothetical protein
MLYPLRRIIWKGLNYLIEHNETIILRFKKLFHIRDSDTSNKYPNTPFTFNGNQFVDHV